MSVTVPKVALVLHDPLQPPPTVAPDLNGPTVLARALLRAPDFPGGDATHLAGFERLRDHPGVAPVGRKRRTTRELLTLEWGSPGLDDEELAELESFFARVNGAEGDRFWLALDGEEVMRPMPFVPGPSQVPTAGIPAWNPRVVLAAGEWWTFTRASFLAPFTSSKATPRRGGHAFWRVAIPFGLDVPEWSS